MDESFYIPRIYKVTCSKPHSEQYMTAAFVRDFLQMPPFNADPNGYLPLSNFTVGDYTFDLITVRRIAE